MTADRAGDRGEVAILYLFFFFGFAFCTLTVVVSIVLPAELTVTIVVSLPNFESSARPVELSVSVSTFVAPAASVTPPLATTTCFAVAPELFFLAAVIAVSFVPLRCSLTVACRLTGAHAAPPAGHDRVTVSLAVPPEIDPTVAVGEATGLTVGGGGPVGPFAGGAGPPGGVSQLVFA